MSVKDAKDYDGIPNVPISTTAKETEAYREKLPELPATAHYDSFDPVAYLKSFYISPHEDEAMKIALFFLPGVIYRTPVGGTLLDLGAGPTVHVPIALRKRVDHIYTSDYSPRNRAVLKAWLLNEEIGFDWSAICDWLALLEASNERTKEVTQYTRSKVRGILNVDVNDSESVIQKSDNFPEDLDIPSQFDTVVVIYCMEYASETKEQFKAAMKNALKLVKPGGFWIQGGIFKASNYFFAGTKFSCHYLTEAQLMETLAENDMTVEGEGFHFIVHDDVFLVLSKKKK